MNAPSNPSLQPTCFRGPVHGAERIVRAAFAAVAVVSASAWADTFSVPGRTVAYQIPTGYCSLGDSPEERKLIKASTDASGERPEFTRWAAPCKDREDFRRGKTQAFAHWIQIKVTSIKGEFKLLPLPREEFLAGLAKAQPTLDAAELNRKVRGSLQGTSIRMANLTLDYVGRDNNAVYTVLRTTMQSPQGTRLLRGLCATTLINYVPITIWAYESSSDGTIDVGKRDRLLSALEAVLQSLVASN